jgi:hypothetical protein
MLERKSIIEMLGEYLREAAVLSGVFIPLDRVLGQKANLTWGYAWLTLSISVGLLAAGILAEKLRPLTAKATT